jgi:hypothetical protein
MTDYRLPSPADVRRGGHHGQFVLPSRVDDEEVQHLVRVLFAPTSPGLEPCAPVLIQQLLRAAPQTDRTGVDDWNRPLRADEMAEIWGTPMEGDPLDVRIAWLRRADELCRAWGWSLVGPEGLAPDLTLPALGENR